MSKEKNQLRAGALLSYLNLGISTIIPFVYTPIMLEKLGQAEYGLYSLAHSVIAYLSLLSFGFGSTIIRYLSMYRAQGQKEEYEKTFGFFLRLYMCVGILVMIGGLIISMNVGSIFDQGLTPPEMEKMKILTIIMAFNSAISFPISVFSSVTISHERYIFRRFIDVIITVAAPIGNLIALFCGFRSVGMALVSTIIQFSILPINVIYCAKVLKVKPRFSKMPKELIKEMLGFSAFAFIATLVDMLFWSTDRTLLGMYASSVAVAIYNIGCTFNQMVRSLSTAISGVLTPRVTGMVAKEKSNKEISDLFIRVGRLQYLIVALIVSGFVVFGQSFLKLWAGDEYSQSYWIALITMIPLCIPLIQNTGISIVTAQNKHAFRSIAYLVIAVINVISTFFAIKVFEGYEGIAAAVCSGISYLVGQGLVMNIFYWKAIKIDIPTFWKNILKMSIVPVCMVVVSFLLKRFISCDTWIIFLVCVAIYAAIYAVGMYLIVLNAYEKDIIFGIVRKLRRKKI